MRAFAAKGRFADWMRTITVSVILDQTTALRGAAAYLAAVEERRFPVVVPAASREESLHDSRVSS